MGWGIPALWGAMSFIPGLVLVKGTGWWLWTVRGTGWALWGHAHSWSWEHPQLTRATQEQVKPLGWGTSVPSHLPPTTEPSQEPKGAGQTILLPVCPLEPQRGSPAMAVLE